MGKAIGGFGEPVFSGPVWWGKGVVIPHSPSSRVDPSLGSFGGEPASVWGRERQGWQWELVNSSIKGCGHVLS